MKFERYQSLKRFGMTEVEGIELGECLIFPKLDGTNSSIWISDDGHPAFGSRNRELSLDNDNAGFMAHFVKDSELTIDGEYEMHEPLAKLYELFDAHPNLRLYGEWLVPHSLKTYRQDAWRRFYVFDVVVGEGENARYMPYDEYQPLMEEYGIDYIPPIARIKNASYEQLIHQMKNNVFLIDEGKGAGEGIVIKNYEYVNKFGKTIWAKMVSNEFKEKHMKTMGATDMNGKRMVEEEIAEKYVTQALVDKTYAKIETKYGLFDGKNIPELLNTIFYDVVNEEMWQILKEHKNPTINFRTLQSLVYKEVKSKSKIFT